MKSNCSLDEIAEILRTKQSFVVMSHVRPDGDALGCEIAMGLCLRALGKNVTIWNEDGMLEKYRFLPCSELVETPSEQMQQFDCAIALDTAVQNRVGRCMQSVDAPLWINIDHHHSNNHYGDLAYIDSTAPATGQILFEFFRNQQLPFTLEMAENLFVAISTDTGSFQYPQTSARTFEIGAELVRMGVNVGRLSQQTYENFPRRRIELLRELLNTLEFACEGKVATIQLSLATADSIGALPEDNEGMIDHIRAIEGVIAAGFFEELPQGKVRISLRSKNERADVCKICALYGGGGHKLAAGARIPGDLESVKRMVVSALCDEIG
jgi:phosphoesterase RecJ-like protein